MASGLITIKNKEIILEKGGVKLDIFNLVMEINIFEDIFSPFLTGQLVILDSAGVISAAQFDGSETISFYVGNPYHNEEYPLTFKIFKITDRQSDNFKTNGYVMHLISSEGISDVNKRISKKFKGKPEEIIKRCVQSELGSQKKFKEVSTTNSPIELVSPFWTPMQIISWVTGKAISKNATSSYFFFESTKGFHFKDIMEEADKIPTFTYYNRIPGVQKSTSESQTEYNLRTIIDLKVKESYDVLTSLSNGMFNSVLYTKDLTQNKYERKDFDYSEYFKSHSHLEKGIPFTNTYSGQSQVKVGYHHSNMFPTASDSLHIREWAQNRMSFNEQLNITNLQITVPGWFAINAGQKVVVEIPKPSANLDDQTDKQLSGAYIITALRHISDKNQHHMVLDLMKESNRT